MRIAKSLFCAVVSAFMLCGTPSIAAVTHDDGGVRKSVTSLRDAVNSSNADAAAGLWTLDGTYLDEDGVKWAGRDSVRKMFATVFSNNAKPKNVELTVDNVRFITDGVAIADGTVNVNGGPANRYSLTLVKDGINWLISSATETRSVPRQGVSQPLKRLSWLVGNWHAERDGGIVDMNAEWIANSNFILCRFDVKKNPQSREVEVQIIGWDPQAQKPISWHFDANGGYGQGLWTKAGDKWTVQVVGTAGDGSTVSATNVISELSKTGFIWQSINRHRNGTWIEDTAQLKVAKK